MLSGGSWENKVSKSRMIRDYLDSLIDREFKDLIVYSDNKNISTIVGDKRSNRIYINEKYKARFKTGLRKGLLDGIIVEIDSKIVSEISFEEMYKFLGKRYGLY